MQSKDLNPSGPLARSEVATAERVRLPRPVREQQMLDAATEIFGKLGYHGASMDQIAEAVGISKPMLYAYFDSKEGLFCACIERAGREMIDAVGSSYAPNQSPEQVLWAGFAAFFEFVRDHSAKWQLVRTESASTNDAFEEIVSRTYAEFRTVIEELARLASSVTPGDPFADEELRSAAAYAMLGSATSLANRWLDTDSKTTPDGCATQLMNFFWLGFNDMAAGEIWSPEVASAVTGSTTD